MSGVNVLAVMDEMIDCYGSVEECQDDNEFLVAARASRAAVAELIEAANLCAEAFCDYLDDEVPGVVAKSYPAVTNLRAALARVGGA